MHRCARVCTWSDDVLIHWCARVCTCVGHCAHVCMRMWFCRQPAWDFVTCIYTLWTVELKIWSPEQTCCLSVCLSVSVCLSIYYMSIHLSICLCVCLSVCLSFFLSVAQPRIHIGGCSRWMLACLCVACVRVCHLQQILYYILVKLSYLSCGSICLYLPRAGHVLNLIFMILLEWLSGFFENQFELYTCGKMPKQRLGFMHACMLLMLSEALEKPCIVSDQTTHCLWTWWMHCWTIYTHCSGRNGFRITRSCDTMQHSPWQLFFQIQW